VLRTKLTALEPRIARAPELVDNEWCRGETYETLEWHDEVKPKPTYEELEQLYSDLLKDEMREERNQLLKDCDYTVLPDFPTANRQA
jgi:hypothetical protein